MKLTAGANERIEARAQELIAESRYAEALSLLEIRFSQPGPPPGLLGPYVLCLSATGRTLRAEQVARAAHKMLSTLPRTQTTEVALALVVGAQRMGEKFAAGAAQQTKADSLWS